MFFQVLAASVVWFVLFMLTRISETDVDHLLPDSLLLLELRDDDFLTDKITYIILLKAPLHVIFRYVVIQ